MVNSYSDIIEYWYSEKSKKHWFNSTPDIDSEIKQRFEDIWIRAQQDEFSDWVKSPEGCLALIILLDQFPLNMYRGKAKSFKTEQQAIRISLHAINKGFDKELKSDELLFLFMPLMHSENITHQEMQVELFDKYNFNIDYSQHHRDIVKKYGRFPHRNKILGRKSSEIETEYLLSSGAFKG